MITVMPQKSAAENGEEGKKRNCHGKKGDDLILKVPAGTIIRDAESDKVIADMSGDNQRQIVLQGGRGGLGNQHYATSTMQAPKICTAGTGRHWNLEVRLELKVIADVGLVGFPNVGKSTFLARVHQCTAKDRQLSLYNLKSKSRCCRYGEDGGFVMADIPGLIEGASEGVGLGHEFLRHIERTKVMIHMVDAASVEGRDPIEDILAINRELEAYNPELLEKPQVIAANKIDAIYEGENEIIENLRKTFEPEGIEVYPISAVSGKGVKELLFAVKALLAECPQDTIVFEQEFFPELCQEDGRTIHGSL